MPVQVIIDWYAWAAETVPSDPAQLTQWGFLGLAVATLFALHRTAYKREQDRADRLMDELLAQNKAIQDRVVPALEGATHAVTEATRLISEIQRDLAYRRFDGPR